MLQWRCGQHDTQFGQVARKIERQLNIAALAQQYDRTCARFKLCLFRFADERIGARLLGRVRHDRKRLAIAVLSFAQSRQRFGVERIAHQVIAAQPLDGHDLACFEQLHAIVNEFIGIF